MTSIIQTVSYKKEAAKTLLDKLAEYLGTQKLSLVLSNGQVIDGIISEVGQDYISIIEGDADTIIPIDNVCYVRYFN